MPELNTGWKHWDKHLSKYIGKPINIMEIGVYKGEATSWFLKNIMTNPLSKIYAIDTFEGSPEYPNNANFKEIERTFKKNIEKTGRASQVVVMKMFSIEALNKILHDFGNNLMFDIIFIDASHEAKDVISDAILSWNLLNIGGTMIFDDYKWDKLVEEHARPKLAVDSFVKIMKPSIETLHSGYQYIIEKKVVNKDNKPIVRSKILDEINTLYNKIISFINKDPIVIPNHKVKLKFNLKFSKIQNYEDGIIDKDSNFLKMITKFNKLKNSKYSKNLEIFWPSLLITPYLSKEVKSYKNYRLFYKKHKESKIISYFYYNTYQSCWFEGLNSLFKNNNFKNKELVYLNFRHAHDFNNMLYDKNELDNLDSVFNETLKLKQIKI